MKLDKNQLSEIVLGLVVVIALVLLINPFNMLMTSVWLLTLLMLLGALMIAFTVFVWRQHPRDEREALQSFKAGRFAYLVGSAVLVVGIMVQSVQHKLDPWLAITLGVIVLSELAISIRSRHQ